MILVASSWRRPYYEDDAKRLKDEDFPVYDINDPSHSGGGFHWTDLDENVTDWTFNNNPF